MLGKLAIFVGLAGLALGAALAITRSPALPADQFAQLQSGDVARGEQVFWAAGCASCHSAPNATGAAKLVLAGGRAFETGFGTFYAPNISPDPVAGIGGWGVADLANAMLAGRAPDGSHYYPAFPYAAYQHASLQDVADLSAYLATLPRDSTPSRGHDLGFPFNIRAGLGLWKAAFMPRGFVLAGDLPPEAARGRYLVEGLGHCGECHTPRNIAGGLQTARWLAGAPNPNGRGTVPNITPAALDWSRADIVAYLETGFTPEYDSAGGHMAEVVENFAKLPESDRAAVAAYLKLLPPLP